MLILENFNGPMDENGSKTGGSAVNSGKYWGTNKKAHVLHNFWGRIDTELVILTDRIFNAYLKFGDMLQFHKSSFTRIIDSQQCIY